MQPDTSRRDRVFGYVVVLVALVVAVGGWAMAQVQEGAPGPSVTETPVVDDGGAPADDPAPDPDDCEARATGLLEDYPEVYATRQEAFDGCEAALAAERELLGEIDD